MQSRADRRVGRLRALAAALLGAGTLLGLTAPGAGAVTANYDFSTGDQGWAVSQGATLGFEVPTFNPAGFIQETDTAADSGCEEPAGTPCNLLFFTGSLPGTMAANYGGTLSFDFATSSAPQFRGNAYIDSTDDNAPELRQAFTPANSGFAQTRLPLTEAGWQFCPLDSACTAATQAQFRSLLASAQIIHVLADVHATTGQTYSLDNVAVTEAPKPKPAAKKKKCKKKKGKKAAAAKKKKCKKKKKAKKGSIAAAGALAPRPAASLRR